MSGIHYKPGQLGGASSVANNILRIPLGTVIDATNRPIQDGAGTNSRYYVSSSDIITIGLSANPNNIIGWNISLGDYANGSKTAGIGSIAIGYKAAYLNLAGEAGIAIGYNAARDNTTFDGGINIGYESGKLATNSLPLFIGHSSGYAVSTSNNVGIGHFCCNNATPGGGECVYIGDHAGLGIMGYGTVGIGSYVGQSFTGGGGNYNTWIGRHTAQSLTGGNNNTFIGANIDYAGALSDCVLIGTGDGIIRYKSTAQGVTILPYNSTNYQTTTVNATGSVTYSLSGTTPKFSFIQAVQLGVLNTTLGSLVFFGNTSGSVTLQTAAVAGSTVLTLPTAYAASNGYVLSSTTAGVLSWIAPGGMSIGGAIAGITNTANQWPLLFADPTGVLTQIASVYGDFNVSGNILVPWGIGNSGANDLTFSGGAHILFLTGASVKIGAGVGFWLGNAATTGLGAGILAALTNASIVITDSAGQAYRIPCII